ncbi:acyl-CoA thioesterase [Microbacterium xanthum]|uniref:acyl-CoA thioesterase n=1 Tax=Microbacterium xanthum TaxID=3079794 RepID=UPI002AD216A1|nr:MULTISPECIES: acyl-CoA thioesterase II [unclassified Microbacterium]MDZ8172378.1 acyl-CoA thioesterase II [Microbacterium sp. KSW-48]MDZ8201904.1 acyl-CoA thioesterase II [Microbacterium sp. SSW1-59]
MTDAETTASADRDPVAAMLDVLDLSATEARTTEDIFTGASHAMPQGRVFGGQVLAQSIVAAERTIPADRAVHSMHGYFLRPGDSAKGITFSVDRIHDGRSFSTRRTQAFQDGVPIFSMIASFQDEDPGLAHQSSMPEGLPAPEDLPDIEALLPGMHPMSRSLFIDRPIDVRHIPSPIYLSVDGEHSPSQAVWLRVRRAIGDDPRVHRAVLAYMSDLTIQESILRAHGIAWAHRGLKVASLDHAMWWHRAARVDEWLLYVQESPSARGGRGLGTGRIFSQSGTLVASVAQEVMVRVPTS